MSLFDKVTFVAALVTVPGAFVALTAASFVGAVVERAYRRLRPPDAADPASQQESS